MNINYIWIKGRRYYYYRDYETWEEAIREAKEHRRKNKCRYFILQHEKQGILDIIAEMRYKLYLDKVIKII